MANPTHAETLRMMARTRDLALDEPQANEHARVGLARELHALVAGADAIDALISREDREKALAVAIECGKADRDDDVEQTRASDQRWRQLKSEARTLLKLDTGQEG